MVGLRMQDMAGCVEWEWRVNRREVRGLLSE